MSQFISLEQAVAMTTLYRTEKEKVISEPFQGKNILARCETFDRSVFETLLSKPGCKSIRIYYGMDDTLKVHAIVVAVNESNEDILPSIASLPVVDDGSIGENAQRCPEDCPPPSALNP